VDHTGAREMVNGRMASLFVFLPSEHIYESGSSKGGAHYVVHIGVAALFWKIVTVTEKLVVFQRVLKSAASS
jgi:hypothetical protein